MSVEEDNCSDDTFDEKLITYIRRRIYNENPNSQEVDSSHKKRKKRKAMDIGWHHGEMVNGVKQHWRCNYCGVMRHGGGVTRLKLHLVGHKDVLKCPNVPDQVSNEIARHLGMPLLNVNWREKKRRTRARRGRHANMFGQHEEIVEVDAMDSNATGSVSAETKKDLEDYVQHYSLSCVAQRHESSNHEVLKNPDEAMHEYSIDMLADTDNQTERHALVGNDAGGSKDSNDSNSQKHMLESELPLPRRNENNNFNGIENNIGSVGVLGSIRGALSLPQAQNSSQVLNNPDEVMHESNNEYNIDMLADTDNQTERHALVGNDARGSKDSNNWNSQEHTLESVLPLPSRNENNDCNGIENSIGSVEVHDSIREALSLPQAQNSSQVQKNPDEVMHESNNEYDIDMLVDTDNQIERHALVGNDARGSKDSNNWNSREHMLESALPLPSRNENDDCNAIENSIRSVEVHGSIREAPSKVYARGSKGSNNWNSREHMLESALPLPSRNENDDCNAIENSSSSVEVHGSIREAPSLPQAQNSSQVLTNPDEVINESNNEDNINMLADTDNQTERHALVGNDAGCSKDGNNWNSQEHMLESVFSLPSRNENNDCNGIENSIGSVEVHNSIREALSLPQAQSSSQVAMGKNVANCQDAFVSIINSDKFSLLRDLLHNNFLDGNSTERNYFDFGEIDAKMKNGDYEKSPQLFSNDVMKLWKNLEQVGQEIVDLAANLSIISRANIEDKVGIHVSDLNKSIDPYKALWCNHCHYEITNDWGLVSCKGCSISYHTSCINPLICDSTSLWYCSACIGKKPHMPITIGADDTNFYKEDNAESVQQCITSMYRLCKICGTRADGEEFVVCSHPECPYKYYHTACLKKGRVGINMQEDSTCWFCPSCLCQVCRDNKDDPLLVLCDGCDEAYHIYCMDPPCDSVPKGKWYCGKCGKKSRRRGKTGTAMTSVSRKSKKNGVGPNLQVNNGIRNEEKKQAHQAMDVLMTAIDTVSAQKQLPKAPY